MEAVHVAWSWLRVEPLQIHLHIYFQDLEDIAHHFHRTEHQLYSCQATKFWLKVASRRSLATTNCYVVSWEAFCIAAPRTQNMHTRCSLQWVLCLDCSQLAAGVTALRAILRSWGCLLITVHSLAMEYSMLTNSWKVLVCATDTLL